LDRRHLIRSAAWAAPVVAVAATAPLAAASGSGTLSNVQATAGGQPPAIEIFANASPAALPELLESYFTIDGEPTVTPWFFTYSTWENQLLAYLHLSTLPSSGRNVTINIPGYAAVTCPLVVV